MSNEPEIRETSPISPTEHVWRSSVDAPDMEAALKLDRAGDFNLRGLRDVALRAGRIAEALLGVSEADVVIVHGQGVWRGKGASEQTEDLAASKLVMSGDDVVWTADARLDPVWSRHPRVTAENGLRFYVGVPIKLRNGYRLGALRAFDTKPHPYDEVLAARLTDLAAMVADECDRLLSSDARRMHDLFGQAPGFIATISADTDLVLEMVNPTFLTLSDRPNALGERLSAVVPEAAQPEFYGALTEVLRTKQPYVGRAVPIVFQRDDGHVRPLLIDHVLQPIVDYDGVVSSVYWQGYDVTDAAQATAALQAREADLATALSAMQAILDNSLDVICTINRDGRFIQVSKRAQEVWGYTLDELRDRPVADLIHPEDRAATAAVAQNLWAGIPTSSFMNRYVRKDGVLVPTMWSAVYSEAHDCMFAVGRDMRETIAAEEALRQAHKMEAIGRLSGGIAHDFNNLLTVMIGAGESLEEQLQENPTQRASVQILLDAGERAAELVRRLLSFSRIQQLMPQILDAGELMMSLEPLLRRLIGSQVSLAIEAAETGLVCLADKTELETAILNLCTNGRDAMPDGGTLVVATVPVKIDQTTDERADDISPGKYVSISVTDTGAGMSSDVIAHALEPFFTTKEVGKGTGLGLSMVYGFAKQSRGHVRIKSIVGRGTTVEILLPHIANAIVPMAAQPADTEVPAGTAHILLVEDDDLVRMHVEGQLAALGYRVTASANGPAALEVLNVPSDIDLLFTDMQMPGGMTGRELAERARVLRPQIRVLFTSGYTNDSIARELRAAGFEELLSKPYRKAELARRIAQALGN